MMVLEIRPKEKCFCSVPVFHEYPAQDQQEAFQTRRSQINSSCLKCLVKLAYLFTGSQCFALFVESFNQL